MMTFVGIAVLLVLVALAIALRPLWRAARGTALALLVLVPTLVAALYAYKGNPEAINVQPLSKAEQIQQAQAELAQITAKDPDNFEAWVLLGRTRMGLQQYPQAAEAFARALALAPDEPNVMVEAAEAQMRSSSDRRFPPAAVVLLERAIVGNPQNQRALFFLGLHQLQQGDPAAASRTWEKLLVLVDASTAAALLPQINEARAQAKLPPIELPTAVAAGPAIKVSVAIDPAIQASLPEGAVLFVFARGEHGGGPPLAARRIEAATFPLQISLSDTDSIMPTQKLSSQQRVMIVARLSASGSATPGTGDIESAPVLVEVKDGATATITLSKRRP